MRDTKEEIAYYEMLERISLDSAIDGMSDSITSLFACQAQRIRVNIEKLKAEIPKKKKKKTFKEIRIEMKEITDRPPIFKKKRRKKR